MVFDSENWLYEEKNSHKAINHKYKKTQIELVCNRDVDQTSTECINPQESVSSMMDSL